MLGKGKSPKTGTTPAAADNAENYDDYIYPPLDLLTEPQRGYSALQEKVVREKGRILEQTLTDFNINATVVEAETGPVITMYELQLAPGIKVSQISNLANDLARSLGAAAVRIVAPIPGKHTIGIEVPNSEKEKVRIKELMHLAGNKPAKMQIPLFLGKDASGEPLVVDLTTMPHVLIAGTTGSGKSVCINSVIVSILMTQRPDLVKLILVDPKMVEMNSFRDLAHLMCPIVTEMKRAEQILEWLTIKMDERYALLAEARVRNIIDYNKLTEEEIYERFCPSNEEEKAKIPLRLPYIVVVIDELADLMMTSAKEVEAYIIRLAQKSRAVGIHIVLATQRPQATVVTGLIKSNLPTRISFRVSARMDSRIVLDQNGAEALLGQGDMLFLQPGTSDLIRAQGTYLDDDEIHKIVDYLKDVSQPSYHPELVQLNHVDASCMEKDELFDEAVGIILETKRGSVSLLQRRLTIGYSRASRLIDQMAMAGIVGEYKGSQAREVLITPEEYAAIKRQMAIDEQQGYADLQEDEVEEAEDKDDSDDSEEESLENNEDVDYAEEEGDGEDEEEER
jgi:S-DNA-T family DNA segregation ATPase FtsK/SpoIIIE